MAEAYAATLKPASAGRDFLRAFLSFTAGADIPPGSSSTPAATPSKKQQVSSPNIQVMSPAGGGPRPPSGGMPIRMARPPANHSREGSLPRQSEDRPKSAPRPRRRVGGGDGEDAARPHTAPLHRGGRDRRRGRGDGGWDAGGWYGEGWAGWEEAGGGQGGMEGWGEIWRDIGGRGGMPSYRMDAERQGSSSKSSTGTGSYAEDLDDDLGEDMWGLEGEGAADGAGRGSSPSVKSWLSYDEPDDAA
jgi:hypothetical protein